MLLKLFQGIIDGLASLLSTIINALPGSPFNGLSALTLDSRLFGYIAYFFPVKQIISVFEAWLAAIALYYLYQIAMRWVKAVGE